MSIRHDSEGSRTDWTKVPHDQWPKNCPKCGAGLSNTSYEPYCAYEDCRWNNEEQPAAVLPEPCERDPAGQCCFCGRWPSERCAELDREDAEAYDAAMAGATRDMKGTKHA